MAEVASRELRNNTRELLERAEGGEEITITVNGRAVALLVPLDGRKTWWSREEFIEKILAHPADRGLLDDLRDLAPDTTDDLPL